MSHSKSWFCWVGGKNSTSVFPRSTTFWNRASDWGAVNRRGSAREGRRGPRWLVHKGEEGEEQTCKPQERNIEHFQHERKGKCSNDGAFLRQNLSFYSWNHPNIISHFFFKKGNLVVSAYNIRVNMFLFHGPHIRVLYTQFFLIKYM